MEDQNKISEATPEQQKEIRKILKKAKIDLLFLIVKIAAIFFAANLVSFLIGMSFLKDVDPEQVIGFQFVSIMINVAFVFHYLDGQIRASSDNVANKVKEVLKNKTEE